MRIGILGSSVVARTLAGGFIKHGHSVSIGTRDPGKLKGMERLQREFASARFVKAFNSVGVVR